MSKFHGIEMVGKFLLQKLTSLPIFNVSRDESRLAYNSTNKKVYIGTDTRWKQIGSGAWGDLNTTFTSGGTLEDGYLYSIDTTTSPLTGYLKTSPTSGDIISIYDKQGTFSLNNFILSGNGNTISGTSIITFQTNDSIASLIYDGTEWKIDIGGLSTGSSATSGSLNFSSISEINTMDSTDKFVLLDSTDGLNKKLTLSNWFSNINVDDNLDVLTSADDSDYYIIYDVDAGKTKKILSSNISTDSGINKLDIRPDLISLDDVNIGVDFGSVFGIYKTIDFSTTLDGSCWITTDFPTNWSTSSDINIDIAYSLNGNDTGKNIRFNVDFWSIIETDTPVSTSSDVTITNDITTSSSNIDKFTEDSLNVIGNTYIESGIKSVVIKLTRDVSEDTYSGTLQLISIKISQ